MIRLLFFLLIAHASMGQDYFSGTTRGLASGLNLHFEDANALFYNPSGLAKIENLEFILSYQSKFLVTDIHAISIGGASKLTESTSIGLSYAFLGATDYQDSKIGLQLGQKIGKNSSAGIGFYARYLDLEEYGTSIKPNMSVGCQFGIGLFDLAGKIENPFFNTWNENEKPPTIYAFGINYHVTEDAAIGLQYYKQINFNRSIMISIEYRFSDQIQFFGGFQTQPQNIHIGMSTPLFHNRGSLTVGNSWFNNIGSSPSASFHYSKRNKQ